MNEYNNLQYTCIFFDLRPIIQILYKTRNRQYTCTEYSLCSVFIVQHFKCGVFIVQRFYRVAFLWVAYVSIFSQIGQRLYRVAYLQGIVFIWQLFIGQRIYRSAYLKGKRINRVAFLQYAPLIDQDCPYPCISTHYYK